MVTVRELKTIGGMLKHLAQLSSVGMVTTIHTAVTKLRESKDVPDNTELTSELLEEIRMAIYDTSDASRGAEIDPLEMLFNALFSQTGNPVEEALTFIEKLQASIAK